MTAGGFALKMTSSHVALNNLFHVHSRSSFVVERWKYAKIFWCLFPAPSSQLSSRSQKLWLHERRRNSVQIQRSSFAKCLSVESWNSVPSEPFSTNLMPMPPEEWQQVGRLLVWGSEWILSRISYASMYEDKEMSEKRWKKISISFFMRYFAYEYQNFRRISLWVWNFMLWLRLPSPATFSASLWYGK